MATCDLANHPRACSIAQSRYPRPQCAGCEAGKKNDALTAEKIAKETKLVPRETVPERPETTQPKKEETVALSPKEMILARVTREKSVAKSKFMQYDRIPAAEIDVAAKELDAEGKIKVWRNGRAMTITLPGGESPWGGLKVIPKPAKKIGRLVGKKPSPATGEPVVRNRKEPPGNGKKKPGPYEDLIAGLMVKRQAIDNAIAALRAL